MNKVTLMVKSSAGQLQKLVRRRAGARERWGLYVVIDTLGILRMSLLAWTKIRLLAKIAALLSVH